MAKYSNNWNDQSSKIDDIKPLEDIKKSKDDGPEPWKEIEDPEGCIDLSSKYNEPYNSDQDFYVF